MVLLLCGFAAITIAVGLMAGLINKGGDCEDKEDGEGGPDTSSATTSIPGDTSTEPPLAGPPGDPFLRETVYPTHYELWLYPDFYFDGNTFYGKENITFKVTKETDVVILHAKMMEISNTVMWDDAEHEITIKKTFMYERNEYWVVEVENQLVVGEYVLHLEFTGSLVNGIVGYYKSNYTNALTGEDR